MAIFSTFGKQKPKAPHELITKTQATLEHFSTAHSDKDREKIGKEATACLAAIKHNLLDAEDAVADVATLEDTMANLLSSNVIPLMVDRLKELDFETRKDVVALFTAFCKYQPGVHGHRVSVSMRGAPSLAHSASSSHLNLYIPDVVTTGPVDPSLGPRGSQSGRKLSHSRSSSAAGELGGGGGGGGAGPYAGPGGDEGAAIPPLYPGLLYLRDHYGVVQQLFELYEVSAIALNCGSMLRDCFRDDQIVRRFVEDKAHMLAFFEKVQVSSFEVASDAFNSFKIMLSRHPEVVANYLATNDAFWVEYNKLLRSENYVTRRQSLKLLSDLLMHRSNVRVMVAYVSDVQNLMLVMNLLKDTSRTIQFEAFHVFKVFVANPRKPAQIKDILVSNQEKLLRYLSHFLPDREELDEDFALEKADIVREIKGLAESELERPSTPTSESQAAGSADGSERPSVLNTSVSFSTMQVQGEVPHAEAVARTEQ